jgi:hypothetical protein
LPIAVRVPEPRDKKRAPFLSGRSRLTRIFKGFGH